MSVRWGRLLLRVAFGLLALVLSVIGVPAPAFELSDQCPPSFEKLSNGLCQLRSLYDFYDSPAQHGGVKAKLPPMPAAYTAEQIDLGRFLFFDPVLSVNRDMSCASCHQPDRGLSDGRKTSLGAKAVGVKVSEAKTHDVGRKELTRATPSLWNVGFLKRLMWDGRADSLTDQALLPLLSEDEMGHTRDGVVAAVNSSQDYRELFAQAFEDKALAGNASENRAMDNKVTLENIALALGAFQTTLISLNSRYDRYAHGDAGALSDQEVRGYNAFRGFVGRCSQCHVPPLFTDSEVAVIGAPAASNGFVDEGAGLHSDDPFVRGGFRVPSLRNVALTAPYFHNGELADLSEVVDFYNNTRGHRAPKSQQLSIHWHVHMTDGPKLSEQNTKDIVAFLSSLNDETMMPQVPDQVPSGLPVLTTIRRE